MGQRDGGPQSGGSGASQPPPPGDIWQCLEPLLVGGRRSTFLAFNKQKPEMLQNILHCIGQAPTAKTYLAQNVNSAAQETLD